LEALLDRKTKDGTILVKKWLQEALRRENISVNVKSRPGFATKSELQAMTKALAKSQSSLLKNKGIIQLAVAALAALDESHSSRWEAFSSAEKILSVSAEDTSQSLAVQIGDFINKSAFLGLHGQKTRKLGASQGVLSFQDALHLMISGYILAGENFPTAGNDGPFSWQEEHLLKDTIVEAILENPSIAKLKFLHGLMEELETNLSRIKSEESKGESSDQIDIDDLDDDQWGKWGDEDGDDTNDNKERAYDDMQLKLELRDRVDNLFKFLHKLSSLKSRNIPLRDGALDSENNFGGDPYASRGLLYKLLTRVLGKNDVTGLEYHSSTVGQLFKSGFRRFGLGQVSSSPLFRFCFSAQWMLSNLFSDFLQAKPSLADQNVILVFVIGGINGVEVCILILFYLYLFSTFLFPTTSFLSKPTFSSELFLLIICIHLACSYQSINLTFHKET
jgi:hypothetical protein